MLRKVLRYDGASGRLFWRERTAETWDACERTRKGWNTKYAGNEAFTAVTPKGYLVGAIFKQNYFAHIVVWALVHGQWPEHQVDHINHDPSDNRVENLRLVAAQDNQKNMKRSSSNTSGVTGVYWDSKLWKWTARIGVDGVCKYLGVFSTKEDAIAARTKAEKEYGFHPNHGLTRQEILGNPAVNSDQLIVSTTAE